jgi:hypothetical protein
MDQQINVFHFSLDQLFCHLSLFLFYAGWWTKILQSPPSSHKFPFSVLWPTLSTHLNIFHYPVMTVINSVSRSTFLIIHTLADVPYSRIPCMLMSSDVTEVWILVWEAVPCKVECFADRDSADVRCSASLCQSTARPWQLTEDRHKAPQLWRCRYMAAWIFTHQLHEDRKYTHTYWL